MARGAVYYHPQFKFHDNETGVKRFVILNEPHGDEPFLVAKTTTNLHNRQHAVGCNPAQKVFYVPGDKELPFPLDTLVQLAELYEFSTADLIKELDRKGIIVMAASKKGLVEEAPEAYKDVREVVDVVHNAGLAKKVARMRPLGVVKG